MGQFGCCAPMLVSHLVCKWRTWMRNYRGEGMERIYTWSCLHHGCDECMSWISITYGIGCSISNRFCFLCFLFSDWCYIAASSNTKAFDSNFQVLSLGRTCRALHAAVMKIPKYQTPGLNTQDTIQQVRAWTFFFGCNPLQSTISHTIYLAFDAWSIFFW